MRKDWIYSATSHQGDLDFARILQGSAVYQELGMNHNPPKRFYTWFLLKGSSNIVDHLLDLPCPRSSSSI